MPSRSFLRRESMRRFHHARKVEAAYQRKIMRVAVNVGKIIRVNTDDDGLIKDPSILEVALMRYEELIKPWAVAASKRMHKELANRDLRAWESLANKLGGSLREEMERSPLGLVLEQALEEQVNLITSLPRRAAERVHKITREHMFTGTRANVLAEQILKSGDVSVSLAKTIARTETSRTATLVTQSRAEAIGSESYIWRTSMDTDVRPIHAWLNGKICRWDSPPISGERGERSHPGCIYNCRCYPEPIITEDIFKFAA